MNVTKLIGEADARTEHYHAILEDLLLTTGKEGELVLKCKHAHVVGTITSKLKVLANDQGLVLIHKCFEHSNRPNKKNSGVHKMYELHLRYAY